MSARRFWIVTALLATALALAVLVALMDLRAISKPAVVDIVVPASALQVDGARVRGEVREGVPPYALHWDGQPPSAVLLEPRRQSVLAAAVFSNDSFDRNLSAVRFLDGEVRFELDARRWVPGAPLIVRVEAVRSRGGFRRAAVAAVLLGLALLTWFAVRRYAACPEAHRRGIARRLAESALFLVIAGGIFASVYPGVPVRVAEVTDEANINGFAAAVDHPEHFALDRMLSDSRQFAWYIPAYLAPIRAVKALGFHYETGNAFIGALIVVLLLFGLRRLFATVSGSAGFGFAAALVLGLVFDERSPADETWSILSVMPRMLFTALVPWVLLLALRCAPSSRRWWIACVVTGLLFHIHPLSAPVLLGALLVAFVAASDEPWRARLEGAALGVAAAAAVMLPYIVVYSLRYQQTIDADPTIAARALQIARSEYGHLSPGLVLGELVRFRIRTMRVLLDGLALILLLRHRVDRSLRFYVGLGVGFLLVILAVPFVDNSIAEHLGRRPFQYEMVRGIRFVDLFLVGALALVVRDWRGSRRAGRWLVVAGALCAVLSFGSGWLHTVRVIGGRARLSWRILNGRPDAESGAAQEAIRAMQALHTADERVAGPVGLRQFDVPLAWAWEDLGPLSYSPSRGLLACADTIARGQPLLATTITDASLAQLSVIYEAQLFFLRRSQLGEALARSERVLFTNDVYAIVDGRR